MRDLLDSSISSLISIDNDDNDNTKQQSAKKGEFNLNGSSFMKIPTKSVSFCDHVEVIEITNREEDLVSRKEAVVEESTGSLLWYSSEELDRVTDEVYWTLELMENEEYCRRFLQDEVYFSTCGLLCRKEMAARSEAKNS